MYNLQCTIYYLLFTMYHSALWDACVAAVRSKNVQFPSCQFAKFVVVIVTYR